MSRLIKKYPYNEKFRDEIGEYAENIKDYELPKIVMHGVKLWDNDRFNFQRIVMEVEAWAGEEEKGVFMKCAMPAIHSATSHFDENTVITVDEDKFCDGIFKCAMDEVGLECNPFIQESLKQLANAFAEKNSSQTVYFEDKEYKGVGIVTAGEDEQIVGLFHSIEFHTNELCVNKYVGTMELNDLDNVNILFFRQEGETSCSMKIASASLQQSAIDGDFYTLSFDLGEAKPNTVADCPAQLDTLPEPYDFSTGTEEDYYKQQNDLLNRLEEDALNTAPDMDQMVSMLLDDSL